MTNTAPIVLFTYNRPDHLKHIVSSLLKNREAATSPLFLFSDGPKNTDDEKKVAEVRQIIHQIDGFKDINLVEQPHNKGLAASIIGGVQKVLNNYNTCIVLEDDLEVSPWFLQFMNQGLTQYQDDQDIFSVAGYCPPIPIPKEYPHEAFRFTRINSWGWGTWRNRWQTIDWEVSDFQSFIRDKKAIRQLKKQGKDLPVMLLKQQTHQISSWAVRFNQACFQSGKTNIYPVKSLVRNIGTDGTGTHMKTSRRFKIKMTNQPLSPSPADHHPMISRAFKKFYTPSLYRRTLNWIKIRNYIHK